MEYQFGKKKNAYVIGIRKNESIIIQLLLIGRTKYLVKVVVLVVYLEYQVSLEA